MEEQRAGVGIGMKLTDFCKVTLLCKVGMKNASFKAKVGYFV